MIFKAVLPLVLVAAVAACAAPAAAPPPLPAVSAEPAPGSEAVRRATPEEMAREQGITVAEARRRQHLQQRLLELAEQVATGEPETFAGHMFTGEDRVMMRFTRDGEAALRRHTADPAVLAAVELQPARWSLRELQADMDLVTRRLRTIGLEPVANIDVSANRAVVYVRNRAEQRRVAEAGIPIPDSVRLLTLAFEERP